MKRFGRFCVFVACTTLVLASFGIVKAQADVVSFLSGSQNWYPWDVRNSGSVDITVSQPRSGYGSLELNLTGGSDKAGAIFRPGFPPGTSLGTLDKLNDLGFEWYRDSSSTVGGHLVPALRLHAAAKVLNKSSNQREDATIQIIWEWVYQNSGSALVDQWVTENDVQNGKFWIWVDGKGGIFKYLTLDQWDDNSSYIVNSTYDLIYDPQSIQVFGVSVAAGSGWNGTFRGFADNVTIGFDDGFTYAANFEPVPEPASLVALGGLGVVGAGWRFVRRRKRVKA